LIPDFGSDWAEDDWARTPPRAIELWHFALNDFTQSCNITLLHPLDVDRIQRVMKALYWVDERPSEVDLRSFLRSLWPDFPGTQKQIRDVWRTVLRNPLHRFRAEKGHRLDGLHTLDRLSEEHGLPELGERLARVAASHLSAYIVAAQACSPNEIACAKRNLDAALEHVLDLQHIRYGPACVGRWWDPLASADPPPGTRGRVAVPAAAAETRLP
jgi:hypothetical protein